MHWLFFRVLRIPEQNRYLAAHGHWPDLPRVWELLLAVYVFMGVIGAMAMVIGTRSLLLHKASWLIFIVPAGGWLVWLAVKQGSGLLRIVYRRLEMA